MNINFYYDKITETGPVPNGILDYCIDEKYWPLPFGPATEADGLTEVISSFYYSMIENNCQISLFTNENFSDHLFYPLEIGNGINVYIPPNTLNHLRTGKMKLLLLGQSFQFYDQILHLKFLSNMFIKMNIAPDNIIIITSDINNSYQELLYPCKSYGIDWWQIESRLILNKTTKKYNTFFKPINPLLQVHNFDIQTFNPNMLFHLYGEKSLPHRTKLIESLENSSLCDVGTITKSDNIKYHTNSLFTIITPTSPVVNQTYMSEINALFTNLDIWQLLVMGKPFIIIGCQQTIKYLNSLGYFTFYDLINEKYDSYLDIDVRIKLICSELTRIKDNDNTHILNNTKKFAKLNKEKFLNRSHMPMFLNLFDKIRYG